MIVSFEHEASMAGPCRNPKEGVEPDHVLTGLTYAGLHCQYVPELLSVGMKHPAVHSLLIMLYVNAWSSSSTGLYCTTGNSPFERTRAPLR
jgi:hypothetical protein